MHKIAKIGNGEWMCRLTSEEVKRLERREGVRKNRAQSIASFKVIAENIEKTYGLPSGSIRVFNLETNKPYRRDVRIATIRKNAKIM